MTKTDAQLHADVAEELNCDPSLDTSKIAVAVHDGIVTLNGSVPSYWQKIEAENAVKRVTGVRGIANDLTVDVPATHRRDDTDIARAAADALSWHSDLPRDLKVVVNNGWITLSGAVNWNFQKEEAERAVKYLSGVKGVTNSIQIKAIPKIEDVRERIKKELERTVDQEANRISISTSNGHVTLTGTVHSWVERDAARRAAWSVPGVEDVENLLAVAP
jgi:osmotically-inducible protein OsmY